MARDVPITIHSGNNDPAVIWPFENADGSPVNLAGSVFALTVQWLAVPARGGLPAIEAGTIQHDSDPDRDGALAIDEAAGSVAWPYTLAESRAIPRGGVARYELTRTIAGATRTWAGGSVVVESFLP